MMARNQSLRPGERALMDERMDFYFFSHGCILLSHKGGLPFNFEEGDYCAAVLEMAEHHKSHRYN